MRLSYSVRSVITAACLGLIAVPSTAQESQPQTSETTPPWSMADEYWGEEAMARSRKAVQAASGAQMHNMLMADRFELQAHDNEEALIWDLQGWYGGDINKFYVKAEGEYSFSEDAVEESEIQALWSRAITPFWDIQTGLRYDLDPKGKTHWVFGMQGLAPYWFEIDAAAFISTDGDLTARIEAEYDILFSQRLILQPRIELEASAQDVADIALGSGVTHLEAGLRLRYEFKREVAPYIGIEWQNSFGKTADFAKAAGEDPSATVFVIGLRAWF